MDQDQADNGETQASQDLKNLPHRDGEGVYHENDGKQEVSKHKQRSSPETYFEPLIVPKEEYYCLKVSITPLLSCDPRIFG